MRKGTNLVKAAWSAGPGTRPRGGCPKKAQREAGAVVFLLGGRRSPPETPGQKSGLLLLWLKGTHGGGRGGAGRDRQRAIFRLP